MPGPPLEPEVLAALAAAQGVQGGGMGGPPPPGLPIDPQSAPGIPGAGGPPSAGPMMGGPGIPPGMSPAGPGLPPGAPGGNPYVTTDPDALVGLFQQLGAAETMKFEQDQSQAFAIAAQQMGLGMPRNPYEGFGESGLPFSEPVPPEQGPPGMSQAPGYPMG